MFTLERLFHLDLRCKWNSKSVQYEVLTDEQYKKLYEPIVHKAKEDLKGLVRPRCLFFMPTKATATMNLWPRCTKIPNSGLS
jgi:hypothetical protein